MIARPGTARERPGDGGGNGMYVALEVRGDELYCRSSDDPGGANVWPLDALTAASDGAP